MLDALKALCTGFWEDAFKDCVGFDLYFAF